MAITITAYTFSKRSNSTKQPDVSGTDFSVSLKEPTSYENPTFKIHYSGTFPHNYIKWGSWYYFVTSVTQLLNDLVEVNCKLDVLATFKTEIGQTSAFVLYDTAANSEIVDRRLSIKTTRTLTNTFATNSLFEGSYTVMVGIVGRTSAGLYAMSAQAANSLLTSLNNWMNGTDILPVPNIDISDFSDFLEGIGECLSVLAHNVTTGLRQLIATGKAPDSIKSALLLPVPASAFSGSNEIVYLGDYNTGITAKKINANAFALELFSLTIPWPTTDWRRNEPYTNVYVYLPYCGTIHLPSSELIGASTIDVNCYVSTNGVITYELYVNGLIVTRVGGNCASNYLIGASNVTPASVAGAVVSGVGSLAAIAATGGAAAAVGVGAGAIVSQAGNLTPLPNSIGATGGGAGTSGIIAMCTTIFHDTNVSPDSVSATIGTPSMAVKQIGTLSGYVQTQAASVAASCDETTRAEINALLDGGIYYE